MRRIISFIMAAAILLAGARVYAAGAIPDHRGTSMDGIEVGTANLSNAVRRYSDLFESAGNQYGVDPNLLAAICMQESSGINYQYYSDGSEMPAWGIMQIEYTLEEEFARFGENYAGERWTLNDRLDESKAVPFAAYLISRSLIKYDCDYMKMVQAYNFGQGMLDKIVAAKGDDWLSERANAAAYAPGWPYPTYGDALYIEHVLRYYRNEIPYIGAKIRINGRLLSFDDQYPLLEKIRGETYTLIPVRGISEALDARVSWYPESQTVVIERGGDVMELVIGSDTAILNDREVPLEIGAMIKNGRTMVPLRFVMEAFGVDVGWDGNTRTVEISY